MKFLQSLFGSSPKTEEPPAAETEHINQEVYKKSVELSEKNKTLSLLRQIDEIVLSAITSPVGIAKQVVTVLVNDNEFQLVAIYLHDKQKDALTKLASAEATSPDGAIPQRTYEQEILLQDSKNALVQSLTERKVKIINTLEVIALGNDLPADPIFKSVRIYPLIVRNEVIGVMVVGQKESEESISDYRKDMLTRLTQVIGIAIDSALLYNEVQSSNERLIEVDKLKDEFVSLASHELRTPMTAVRSYLSMIADPQFGGGLNAQQQEYLNNATLSVNRLIQMVNDMLNISRIESGRLVLSVVGVNLSQIVDEVKKEVLPRMNELGVNLVIDANPNLPPVIADVDKIKEVLINLIGNSMKFTPKGGTVTVSLSQHDEMIEIKVADTGCGIDADDLPKLFQKFNRISNSATANQPSGTGLGLYLSKALVELHKGKIWATSAGVGKGSEFTFSLKVFNEKDFQEFQAMYAKSSADAPDIIHTQV